MSTGATAEQEQDTVADFGGWKATGRKTVGTDSELVEVENPDGHKQTAIVYDKAWRDHDRLTTDVELVQSFMEFPMVEGVSCLTRAPSGQGVFQYDTGSVLALIEVLRAYRDQRKVVGLRAAVDVMKGVGLMLQEASENGPMQGIYSHGGLTPWRIMLDAEGTIQLIGYGLPQMDMVALRDDEGARVRDDAFRYCPPERLTSGYEDISTDVYGLVLIAYELATGKSLIDGRAEDMKRTVIMGEAHGLLIGDRSLPSSLKDAMVHALAFDPIGRYEQPWEFVQAITAAEGQIQVSGESLREVMNQVRQTTRRGKALMDVGTAGGPRRSMADGERQTRMRSALEARPIRAPSVGAPVARPGAPARPGGAAAVEGGGRWGRADRASRGASAEDEATPTNSGESRWGRASRGGDDAGGDDALSRRSRLRRGAEDATPSPAPAASAPADEGPRARLRRSASEEPAAPAASAPTPAAAPDESPRARLRRSASEEPAAPAASPPAPAAAPSAEEGGVRSRLRRSSAEEPAAPAASPATPSPTAPPAAAAPAEEGGVRSRLRRSSAEEPAAPAAAPAAPSPTVPPAPAPPAEEGGLRSRLRRSAPDEAPPTEAPAPSPSPPPAEEGGLRSRLRRSAPDEAASTEAPAPSPAPPPAEEGGLRSRLRRSTSDEAAPPAAPTTDGEAPLRTRRRLTDE
jgi:hypothetical protein